jgi:alpha-glucosidase (family GH31 glycosyl hydrolase)
LFFSPRQKADGTDPYIIEVLDPKVTWLRYRTAYYNDTFQILRQLIGPEALIMSRPVDADLDYSPRDVVFMGWVGDEEGTYAGLQTALRYMLESGRRGYVGFGSDIGGYRTDPNAGSLGRTKELFLRWTAIGALSSFMENGGNGEHLPWNFDAETVDIYRSWVNLHYTLVPYLFTEGTKVALAGNGTLMRRCDDIETLFAHTYFLGPNVYVVPVLRDPVANQTQRLWLPVSTTDKWIYAFNTAQIHRARSFIHEDTSRLDQIPMYVQQSSLIPMYDLQHSQSLDAFKFILWGEALFDKQSASLFTRDGQEWQLELDRSQRRLTIYFVRMHHSNLEKQQPSVWTWRFCQYAQGEQICSTTWSQLRDGIWSELDVLV